MQGNEVSGMSSDAVRCILCRHSVLVRGRDQLVCLAFLSILSAQNRVVCSEFEGQTTPPIANAPITLSGE